MIEGGVDLIQLRGKTQTLEQLTEIAGKLHTITSRAAIPLIINDHALVAQSVPLEGVHVGQDDDPVAVARKKAGRALLVGKSTHSFEQALAAQREGADYIGFGPIFATPTKPDYQANRFEGDQPRPCRCRAADLLHRRNKDREPRASPRCRRAPCRHRFRFAQSARHRRICTHG